MIMDIQDLLDYEHELIEPETVLDKLNDLIKLLDNKTLKVDFVVSIYEETGVPLSFTIESTNLPVEKINFQKGDKINFTFNRRKILGEVDSVERVNDIVNDVLNQSIMVTIVCDYMDSQYIRDECMDPLYR